MFNDFWHFGKIKVRNVYMYGGLINFSSIREGEYVLQKSATY